MKNHQNQGVSSLPPNPLNMHLLQHMIINQEMPPPVIHPAANNHESRKIPQWTPEYLLDAQRQTNIQYNLQPYSNGLPMYPQRWFNHLSSIRLHK